MFLVTSFDADRGQIREIVPRQTATRYSRTFSGACATSFVLALDSMRCSPVMGKWSNRDAARLGAVSLLQ